MERRLRDSEERFRRLFQEGISGNFLADAQDRVIEATWDFENCRDLGGYLKLLKTD